METLHGFSISPENKKLFENDVWQRLEKGQRVNLFFATNYYSGCYYYLYQLHVLAQFAKFENVHFYISFADTVSATKSKMHFSVGSAHRNEPPIEANFKEIRAILRSLGVKDERMHFYESSDLWFKFMSFSNQNITNFYKGVSVFPLRSLKMPKSWTDNWYVPRKTKINVAYGLQKYMDLMICSFFHNLFPDEIEGKVDLIFVGALGSELTLKVRESLVKEHLMSPGFPIVASIKKIPMFGHTASIHKDFVSPNWDMDAGQIYNVIDKFHVKSAHIKRLFDNFLELFLDEFYCLGEKNKIVKSKAPPSLARVALDKQRLILAHNLHKFLRETREKCRPIEVRELLHFSKETDIKTIGRLLKSDIALSILQISSGMYSPSELAKKLNKHASNINPIIQDLKKVGLVEVNGQGKLVRKTNQLSIAVPFRSG